MFNPKINTLFNDAVQFERVKNDIRVTYGQGQGQRAGTAGRWSWIHTTTSLGAMGLSCQGETQEYMDLSDTSKSCHGCKHSCLCGAKKSTFDYSRFYQHQGNAH